MKAKKKRKIHPVLLIALLALLFYVGSLAVPALERLTYPLRYEEIIGRISKDYDLDPYWAAAVIYCESGFHPEAKSRKGALGLMQLMPETGAWIAEKLDMTGFTSDQLKEPEINIRCGCWYLAYLQKRFHGDRILMAAAYNAGPGKVDSWLQNEKYSAEGELQFIPYEETRNYVEKIQRAYQKYQALYPDCWQNDAVSAADPAAECLRGEADA